MGALLQQITLIGPAGEATIEALVGTDSMYTWVPRPVLEGLGITPMESREFERPDGSVMDLEVANVKIKINGQTLHTLVVFDYADRPPLLGTLTLEIFGLGVDPTGEKLIRVPGKLMTPRLVDPTR